MKYITLKEGKNFAGIYLAGKNVIKSIIVSFGASPALLKNPEGKIITNETNLVHQILPDHITSDIIIPPRGFVTFEICKVDSEKDDFGGNQQIYAERGGVVSVKLFKSEVISEQNKSNTVTEVSIKLFD